jgi:2,5-diketo-D-gluconate reductase B
MKRTTPYIGPIPAVGLGTWHLTGSQCTNSVKTALELGYRHIDTADYYKNHAAIAEGIRGFPRGELFLVSKIAESDLAPSRVAAACERFLDELKTPYLNLLLIHWPSDTIAAEQTIEEMVKLKTRGLIHHVGVSNFMLSDLHAIERYHFPLLTNQIELHPYLQEENLVNYCEQKGIITVAYRPIQRAEVKKEPLLIELGKKHNKSAIQITLRWLFQRKIVSIPKATSQQHLKENLEIFDFALSDDEIQKIKTLEANRRFVV